LYQKIGEFTYLLTINRCKHR